MPQRVEVADARNCQEGARLRVCIVPVRFTADGLEVIEAKAREKKQTVSGTDSQHVGCRDYELEIEIRTLPSGEREHGSPLRGIWKRVVENGLTIGIQRRARKPAAKPA